ncbi:MAG: GNAT family N-acetyltransferase [Cellulosilyticaceae bacterium]
MEIRKGTCEDISLIVENRLEFLERVNKAGIVEHFEEGTYAFLEKHLQDDSLISYLAVENERIVATVMLCIYDIIPSMSNPSGRTGYICNVYTLENYRHQGLATKLIEKVIEESQNRGVGKVYLYATDEGFPLYKKAGFELLDKEMVKYID